MPLPVFFVFVIIVVLATGVGSFTAGVGAGVIALRMVVVLVALQVAYFAVLMLSAYLGKAPNQKTSRADDTGTDEKRQIDPVAETPKN